MCFFEDACRCRSCTTSSTPWSSASTPSSAALTLLKASTALSTSRSKNPYIGRTTLSWQTERYRALSHARRAQKIKNLLVHALILHQTHIRDEALTFSSSTKLTSTLQSDKNKKGQGYWVMYMYTVYSFPHNLKFRTCTSVAISLFFPFIIFTFALLCLNFRHLWYKFCHVFPVHFMIFSNTVIYSSLLDLIVIINLISSSNMFKHYSLMLLHVKISYPKY